MFLQGGMARDPFGGESRDLEPFESLGIAGLTLATPSAEFSNKKVLYVATRSRAIPLIFPSR